MANGNEAMAFDLWVRHILRDNYGHVAREPIPAELLSLLEDKRQR